MSSSLLISFEFESEGNIKIMALFSKKNDFNFQKIKILSFFK